MIKACTNKINTIIHSEHLHAFTITLLVIEEHTEPCPFTAQNNNYVMKIYSEFEWNCS